MSKKIIKPFVLSMFISYASQAGAFANDLPGLMTASLFSGIADGENPSFSQAHVLFTKTGVKYDKSKEPRPP